MRSDGNRTSSEKEALRSEDEGMIECEACREDVMALGQDRQWR